MTPQEIKLARSFSSHLDRALVLMRKQVWRLFREGVFFVTDEALTSVCERCCQTVVFTFKSPYNSWHPGWCLECILQAFYADEPLYNPYRDPYAPEYNARYDRECRFWEGFLEEQHREQEEDDDGPPIA